MKHELGRYLPSRRLREYYYDLSHVLNGDSRTRIPVSDVQTYFIKLESSNGRTPEPAALHAMSTHHNFYIKPVDINSFSRMIWFFIPDRSHISYYLTQEGNDKSLLSVTAMYLSNSFRHNNIHSWKESDVLSMVEIYRNGGMLPPVIVSERPAGARPDGNLHIIDGVHRMLALGIHYFHTGKLPTQIGFFG